MLRFVFNANKEGQQDRTTKSKLYHQQTSLKDGE